MNIPAGTFPSDGHEAQLLLPVVETLMASALDIMHAQRGLLIRLKKGSIFVEATAHASPEKILVDMHTFALDQSDIPFSLVEEVLNTREPVNLETSPGGYNGADPFLKGHPDCAVVILPLLKRDGMVGMLYLERQGHGTRVTPEHMRSLQLLAWQAAVSIETARLYAATSHEDIDPPEVEKSLLESRAMLLLAEQINQSGSWTWDVVQGVVHCSAEFCRIHEIEPYIPSISLDRLVQQIHQGDREQVLHTLDEAVRTQGTLRFEHRIVARNGEMRYLSVAGHPILETNANVYVGTVTDFSSRKTDELAQSSALAELSRGARMTTINQMTALIAHEVNQPLMAISANAGAALIGIERKSLDTGKFKQLLREIVEQSQRAGAIVQKLQAMTYQKPAPEPVDLHMVIRQVLLTMRGDFDRHQIKVELNLRDKLVIVDADMALLQQVLANLIGNAVEAMHTVEGRVRLLQIASRSLDANQIEVSVEDNGPGADATTYEHMFEPFFGTKQGSIGMGLAICRSIVASHGGSISAHGRHPHGCSVIFTIAEQVDIVPPSVASRGDKG